MKRNTFHRHINKVISSSKILFCFCISVALILIYFLLPSFSYAAVNTSSSARLSSNVDNMNTVNSDDVSNNTNVVNRNEAPTISAQTPKKQSTQQQSASSPLQELSSNQYQQNNYEEKNFADATIHWVSKTGLLDIARDEQIIEPPTQSTQLWHPDAPITHADIVSMLYNFAKTHNITKLNQNNLPIPDYNITSYSDNLNFKDYTQAINWAYINNLSSYFAEGFSCHPTDNITISDLLSLLHHFADTYIGQQSINKSEIISPEDILHNFLNLSPDLQEALVWCFDNRVIEKDDCLEYFTISGNDNANDDGSDNEAYNGSSSDVSGTSSSYSSSVGNSNDSRNNNRNNNKNISETTTIINKNIIDNANENKASDITDTPNGTAEFLPDSTVSKAQALRMILISLYGYDHIEQMSASLGRALSLSNEENMQEKIENVDHSYHVSVLTCYRAGYKIYGEIYVPSGNVLYKKRPAIIMEHGYGGSSQGTGLWAKELVRKGYVVYCFDFCGGGMKSKSDLSPTQMSPITEYRDLCSVVERIKALPYVDSEKIYLCGVSQGGLVAAMTANSYQDDIAGLILLFPAFNVYDKAHNFYPSLSVVPDTMDFFPGMTVGRKYVEDVWTEDIYSDLGKYDNPVLILHGYMDDIVDISYSVKAEHIYPNAVLVGVEDAGHGFQDENFELALDYIYEYLFTDVSDSQSLSISDDYPMYVWDAENE